MPVPAPDPASLACSSSSVSFSLSGGDGNRDRNNPRLNWLPQRISQPVEAISRTSSATVPKDLPKPLQQVSPGLEASLRWSDLIFDQEVVRPSRHRMPWVGLASSSARRAWSNLRGKSRGCWSCRTPLEEGDPPVYSDAGNCYYQRPGFLEVCASLSHFLITLSLQEAVMSAPILLAVEFAGCGCGGACSASSLAQREVCV